MKVYPLEFNGIKTDPVLFTQGFVPGCQLKICQGQCCNWGVYVDKPFKDVILKFAGEIQAQAVMDAHQPRDTAKWFEAKPRKDAGDFPSGWAIRTAVYQKPLGNAQCVFNGISGISGTPY